jgi:hypothetical protein
MYIYIHLVGGIPTPSEKYQSVGMIIPNIWKNKKCSKPPTRHIYIYLYTGHLSIYKVHIMNHDVFYWSCVANSFFGTPKRVLRPKNPLVPQNSDDILPKPSKKMERYSTNQCQNGSKCHWIGLRENLQETMVFTIKYRVFL